MGKKQDDQSDMTDVINVKQVCSTCEMMYTLILFALEANNFVGGRNAYFIYFACGITW